MNRFFLTLAAVLLSLSTLPLQATTVLSNPGFESDVPGTTSDIPGWNPYGGNAYIITDAAIAHSGTNYFKVYQNFSGAVNYTGIYQDYISGPGAVYSANGWAYTSASDTLAGQNAAWIEVTFRDASANILATYRSATITTNIIAGGAFPTSTWIDLSVTNQYDPNSLQITNHTTRLIAPAGTYFVRYQITFQGDALYSAGSMYFDDLNLSQTGGSAYGNWNIVWSDEFNGSSINPKTWTYDTGAGGWGNNELEYYTSDAANSYVSGGYLHIVALKQSEGGQNYTSARMKSEGLFSFQYGRIEWRAQLPNGAGFWPALWMLGTNITTIGWPDCGEIDVMENAGNNLGSVQGSLHSGSDETAGYNFLNGDSVTNFHTYALDWATNAILFYVDGHLYESQTNWSSSVGSYPTPFNRPFFIIMNIAVGGNYLGNPGTNTINTGSFPGEMLVDYVRIYNQTAPLQISISRNNSDASLNWPGNIVCHLQEQTNMLGTNWLNLTAGSNSLTIQTTNQAMFYRLASP
ncbi:MAG: glycoside hydrolase family 16 protein [Verrucomicrobiota bacterium]|jgi:beta-glucanase (GH16 family)